jgi:release factor glutamine methyltransferase
VVEQVTRQATLRAALDDATARLALAGVASPRVDAELLAAHALGVSRSRLIVDMQRPIDLEVYDALVRRRCAREPLQHITGAAHFRHIELAVGPGVFTPRPETEVVAGYAIDWLLASRLKEPLVVDLCTGSGAVALAIADEVPGARVHGVELDPDAYQWAVRNCSASSVRLHLADVAEALPQLDGKVDVVVSNPPYIPDDAVIRDPEVAAHDPALALWGGTDGLDTVRTVERTAARLLRPEGLLVIEHADLQGEAVPDVLRTAGCWLDVEDHLDLAGRDRYATARRGSDR